jgi:hypothetical protein
LDDKQSYIPYEAKALRLGRERGREGLGLGETVTDGYFLPLFKWEQNIQVYTVRNNFQLEACHD